MTYEKMIREFNTDFYVKMIGELKFMSRENAFKEKRIMDSIILCEEEIKFNKNN